MPKTKTKKYKHIVVDEYVYDTLAHMGHTGMSFNDVITELLKKRKVS